MQNTFNQGDLIVAYEKGYHTFVSIEDSIVSYVRKFNSNGKPCNSSKILKCHICFCKPAKEEVRDKIKKLQKEIELLQNILKDES